MIKFSTPSSVAEKLQDALKNGNAFSLVRLGDGENTIFQYPEFCSFYRMQAVITRAIDGDFNNDKYYSTFKENLLLAIESSDILGMFDSSHPNILSRIYSEHLEDVQFKDSATFCTPGIHLYLQQSGHLESLIRISDKVTLITGRNVIDKFKSIFPSVRVSQILLPTEKAYRLSHENGRGLHFPHHFENVREEIKGGKGHLVLIGAGFLGKSYCNWAKNRGAVAIDIGSVFDYWAETPTREGYVTIKDGSLCIEKPSIWPSMSLGSTSIGENASSGANLRTAAIVDSPNNFVKYFSRSCLTNALTDMNINASDPIEKDKYRILAALYIWLEYFRIAGIYCIGKQNLDSYTPNQYHLKDFTQIEFRDLASINDEDCGVVITWSIKHVGKHELDILIEVLNKQPEKVFFCDYRVYNLIKEKINPTNFVEHDLKLHTVSAYGSAGFLTSRQSP
jgi:hypothetical protein